ncbi:MAG: FHA domain-containing protein [Deltaproteobacteria bacterium]|nr:FHA domain-containing protein [Deltaproteobacteria bacterium]
MIKILLKYKQKVLKKFEIDKDKITIGRHESNDIDINNPAVSKQHARIIKKQGNYLIEDLKSTNGTYLNTVRIISRYLKDNDVINIGKHTLLVNIKTENDKNPTHSPKGHIMMLNIERLR